MTKKTYKATVSYKFRQVTLLFFGSLLLGSCSSLISPGCQIQDGYYAVTNISNPESNTLSEEEKEYIDNLNLAYKERSIKPLLFVVQECEVVGVRLQFPWSEGPSILLPYDIFLNEDESMDMSISNDSFDIRQNAGEQQNIFAGSLVSDGVLQGEFQLDINSINSPSSENIGMVLHYYTNEDGIIQQPTDWEKADTHHSDLAPKVNELEPIQFSDVLRFQWEASLYKEISE